MARICEKADCTAAHWAKGLCSAHYAQTPEQVAYHAAYSARYRGTPEGKATKARASARYAETEKGKMAVDVHNGLWRAIKAGAVIGDVPPDTRAILRERFGETCLVAGCDNPATDVDHVIALANGGAHDISNFQTLCGSCNSAKGKASTDHRPKEEK